MADVGTLVAVFMMGAVRWLDRCLGGSGPLDRAHTRDAGHTPRDQETS
jgi:hypothetical protein